MKHFATTCALASLLVATAAIAEDSPKYHSETDVSVKPDGQYEATSTTERTAPNGTKMKTESTESLDKTLTGKAKLTSKVETTQDPKGLGNKQTADAKVTVKADDKGNSEKTVSSHSVDAAGTTHKKTVDTEVDAKSDGSKEITTTSKVVTDPKGLGNKTVQKSETVTMKHPDGSVTTEKN